MARVTIQRQWPDGDTLAISIKVDDSYPDVVAEARQAAVKAFEDATELMLGADDEAGE